MAQMAKNRKNYHFIGGANEGSSPNYHHHDGGYGRHGHKGGNAGNNNGGGQNKGKVPRDFAECRICYGKFHWESDCRKNPAGVGKRRKDSPNCRECHANHWEDQCRTWKSKNWGVWNGNHDHNHRNHHNSSDENGQGNSTTDKCLAPTGEDITRFFPLGKFPTRPCKRCRTPGHWNDACEKEGFDPVINPNPGAKKKDHGKWGVAYFPDGNPAFNQDSSHSHSGTPYLSPPSYSSLPGTPYSSPPNPQHPAIANISPAAPKPTNLKPNYTFHPTDPRNPFLPNNNTENESPDYIHPYRYPPSSTSESYSRSRPDSPAHRAQHRSHLRHGPTHAPGWNGNWNWNGDPSRTPAPNRYVWPHPRNVHRGVVWGENMYEGEEDQVEAVGAKEIWIKQYDREGGDCRRLRWGVAPGGVGGEEYGGMCRFDGQGDVVMVDIRDLEVRRRRRREREREREKFWW
ncbi:hypothetical protein DSL72_002276 [Monilinia vaccinii-corymbosi]|uniref:CCHC-type domain-containing protein n=1 Tax=Monilinia vaccinii-corymbosi TaxID=61207 RepID=A0A8A3PC67_9HELO|nr:hypothetical protein DSL72_002276 [Monilinia vaccinii-corymbosi]